jgi:hypothetical protein
VDSVSTTPEKSRRPYWGGEQGYDPTKFIAHGIKDLLPFYLQKTPPIPILGALLRSKSFSNFVSHLDLDVKYDGRYDPNSITGGQLTNVPGVPQKESRYMVRFSIVWE